MRKASRFAKKRQKGQNMTTCKNCGCGILRRATTRGIFDKNDWLHYKTNYGYQCKPNVCKKHGCSNPEPEIKE